MPRHTQATGWSHCGAEVILFQSLSCVCISHEVLDRRLKTIRIDGIGPPFGHSLRIQIIILSGQVRSITAYEKNQLLTTLKPSLVLSTRPAFSFPPFITRPLTLPQPLRIKKTSKQTPRMQIHLRLPRCQTSSLFSQHARLIAVRLRPGVWLPLPGRLAAANSSTHARAPEARGPRPHQ